MHRPQPRSGGISIAQGVSPGSGWKNNRSPARDGTVYHQSKLLLAWSLLDPYHAPMRSKAVVVLIGAICTAYAFAASDVDSRGRALIQQAQEKTDIFALPSFRMDAIVRIDNDGKPLDGTYSLVWNGPAQWREEITFPGYTEIQVGNHGIVHLKRTAAVMPYRIFQLHSTLGFGSTVIRDGAFFNLKPQDSEKVDKVRDRKLNGAKVTCVEISDERNHLPRQVCIDQATGVLNREYLGFIDTGWASVGPKIFPRSMKLLENGKPVVMVNVTDMQAGQKFSPAMFDSPPGAVAKDGCMNPLPAHPIKDVVPKYPDEDKRALHQGVVAVYALIDQNGIPQDLQTVLSASPGMDKSSLDSIRQRRYAPATCNNKAVPAETVIVTRFTIGS